MHTSQCQESDRWVAKDEYAPKMLSTMFSSLKFKTGILASSEIKKQKDRYKRKQEGKGKEKEKKKRKRNSKERSCLRKEERKGKMERKLSQATSLRDDC